MAMTEPSMSKVLDNVEQSLREEPPNQLPKVESIDRFVPAKHRGSGTNAATLRTITDEIRKSVESAEQATRMLDEYAAHLRAFAEEQRRRIG